jgi:Holliday junction resolvase RusA-like endonuclease
VKLKKKGIVRRMIVVRVEKIRSYQTLVYKRGNNSFQKKEYKDYQDEIRLQLLKLNRIKDLRNIKVSIHFKCKNKVVGDLDNITKPILDILQRNGYIVNDKQITELNLKKSFNHKENIIEIEISEV